MVRGCVSATRLTSELPAATGAAPPGRMWPPVPAVCVHSRGAFSLSVAVLLLLAFTVVRAEIPTWCGIDSRDGTDDGHWTVVTNGTGWMGNGHAA